LRSLNIMVKVSFSPGTGTAVQTTEMGEKIEVSGPSDTFTLWCDVKPGSSSPIAAGPWPTFRLLGVDVHAVSKARVGQVASHRLLCDHIPHATRGAGLRVVGGDGDVHGAVGCGGAHHLQGPLFPLLAVVDATKDGAGCLAIVTGSGAGVAGLV